MIKSCEACDVNFSVVNWNKNKKFCSHNCYWESKKKKIVVINCRNCGKEITKMENNSKIFCNKKCSGEFKRKHNPNNKQIVKRCKYCECEFILPKYNNTQKFCSRYCFWEYRRNNKDVIIQSNQLPEEKIRKICKTCGCEFDIHKYREHTAKFCSVGCFRKSGYCVSKFSQDVFKELKNFYNDIIDEEIFNFDDRKIIPDIRRNNKIIECYGDYWHCNPDMYSSEYFHKHKKEMADEIWAKDNIRIKYLENKNYNVFILWEKDWNNKKELMLKQMKEFLK